MSDSSSVSTETTIGEKLLLTVSIVAFEPDPAELRTTLESLGRALEPFKPGSVLITLVDNSRENTIPPLLEALPFGRNIRLIHGHGNVGFGRGHNLALDRLGEFHLILNPDIQLQPDALRIAVDFMRDNPDCALLSPHARWPNGQRQYLCKRFPAVFDLLLRGFAPQALRSRFDQRLSRYEMRAESQDAVFRGPPIVSGCFMFFRSGMLKRLTGFDPGYMLYFEDFDLSLRSGQIAPTAYVPDVRIVHAGGHAARKGSWHIRQFIRSAARFYMTHGLRLF
ncbi:glycosyltransferase [Mesorhizobium sp. RMAD-H1]|uniref:glycosyltransferase n=1 Tax=Mesorhizobium sp. RMAD-H1 TaxID=2587065 RepID=UPI001611A2DB|nr:glycosyltransferase [Mesorhizobium sp. RMAD-H1]MBB2970084.1 hypothetical protein [Mesorhizobium sp. RMAD-H1]